VRFGRYFAKVNVPAIFITSRPGRSLELGDRIAVVNQGHIEQIGTPFEIYNQPATEYVATFLGAANILDAVVRQSSLEVGTFQIPAQLDQERFKDGDCVKIVFRPEDVTLTKTDFVRPGHHKIGTCFG
jgi:ABC-type Fe3+/spermidine/putrescine transport system ATPase subunit